MSFTPFGTMSDLRSYSDLTITTFNVVEGGRSGLFDLDSADTATADDSAMIVIQGSSRRFKRRYEGHVLPQWFGAIGNGVADDTIPIQAALNFAGYVGWTGTVGDNTRRSSGSSVYLKPVSVGYRITSTLKIGAYTKLFGDVGGGFWFNDTRKRASVIIPDFSNPLNWAIDSDVYLTGGVPLAFDEIVRGEQFDEGLLSATIGIIIENISIMVKSGTRLFGGIRMACAQQSRIMNCYVRGTDIGYSFMASWGSEIDSRSETAKCGVFMRNDNNGIILNGYYDKFPSLEPLPETEGKLFDAFGTFSGIDESFKTKTYGVWSHYSYGLAGTSVIVEHWDVGVAALSASFRLESLYAEGNATASIVTYGCKLEIGHLTGARNGCSLYCGSDADVYFSSIDQETTPFSSYIHRHNTFISVPQQVAYYQKGIHHRIEKNNIYVKATDPLASATNHGFSDRYPVSSINEALLRITDNYSFRDNTINRPTSENFTIHILDDSSYTLTGAYLLYNGSLNIVGNSSAKPTVNVNLGRIQLHSAKLSTENINWVKNTEDYGQGTSSPFWLHDGSNDVLVKNCSVLLPENGFVVHCFYGTSMINLILTGTDVNAPVSGGVINTTYLNERPNLLTYLRTKGNFTGGIQTITRSGYFGGGISDGVRIPDVWINKAIITLTP
ncbi:glycosyl hydrolase family 28-related protein [Dyadobacter sp. LHD-138]|uniref:glycosyl hydrolase family 28-related protein n=1 Tax=Dyadobacter sp. LHD-138 TaxID=3071413 RepID=UPI0027E05488|nr:glycosyl hydrolase family 28-related protein [Dyadobacter sp. LHD-138]MDQ6482251.1 glycosyl hydrolase family 28-related protein [Dyadobacter sp. LHD-138]